MVTEIFIELFFSVKDRTFFRRIRGHEATLAMDQYKLDIRKFSFSQTVNEWNGLSADCEDASSVSV